MRRAVTRFVVLGVVAAAIGVGVAASGATVSCTARSTGAHFAAWGDKNQYFRAPGGGFELSLSNNWTMSGGAMSLLGNEPWRVVNGFDAMSLTLPFTGTATSPTFCVTTSEDSLRFFVRKPGVRGAQLHVSVRVTAGVNVATMDVDIDGSTYGWTPTDRYMLPDIHDNNGRQNVTITFSTRGSWASWLVDDVMVDPWRTF